MRGLGSAVRGADWLDRAAGVALALVCVAGLSAAVRLGASAGADGGELAAQVRARVERRIAAEREQIRPLLAGYGFVEGKNAWFCA